MIIAAAAATTAVSLGASAWLVYDGITTKWRKDYAQWERPDFYSDAAAERHVTLNQIMLADSWSDEEVEALMALYDDAPTIEAERELPNAMMGSIESWVEVELLRRDVMNSVGERLRFGPDIDPGARDQLRQWLIDLLNPVVEPPLRRVAANNLIYGRCVQTPAVRDLLLRIAHEDSDRDLANLIVRKLDHEDLVQQWIREGKHHEFRRR